MKINRVYTVVFLTNDNSIGSESMVHLWIPCIHCEELIRVSTPLLTTSVSHGERIVNEIHKTSRDRIQAWVDANGKLPEEEPVRREYGDTRMFIYPTFEIELPMDNYVNGVPVKISDYVIPMVSSSIVADNTALLVEAELRKGEDGQLYVHAAVLAKIINIGDK